jgi:hypothetical protein
MTGLVLPRLISCDEAGFTGNRLLDQAQPYFAYASVDLSLDEASVVIADIRARHQLQMSELKASKLMRRRRGRAIIAEILAAIDGRYIATLYDKRLSLAAKFFEYIYEPVLKDNNILFYRHNLHRYVATFIYTMLVASGTGAEAIVLEFETFMRSLDPADAPSLFCGNSATAFDAMLDPILRFARGYNVIIAQDTHDLRLSGDTGKWILDLSLSAVTDHLRIWGERYPILEVVCDDSKPLRALAGVYDVMVNRPDAVYMDLFSKRHRITWNMSKPIEFASSASNPAVQMADIVAGATAAAGIHKDDADFQEVVEPISRHMAEECILPDFEYINLEGDEAPVNGLILHELAHRADNGYDPLHGMEAYYAFAKTNLPEYRRITALERDGGTETV